MREYNIMYIIKYSPFVEFFILVLKFSNVKVCTAYNFNTCLFFIAQVPFFNTARLFGKKIYESYGPKIDDP